MSELLPGGRRLLVSSPEPSSISSPDPSTSETWIIIHKHKSRRGTNVRKMAQSLTCFLSLKSESDDDGGPENPEPKAGWGHETGMIGQVKERTEDRKLSISSLLSSEPFPSLSRQSRNLSEGPSCLIPWWVRLSSAASEAGIKDWTAALSIFIAIPQI